MSGPRRRLASVRLGDFDAGELAGGWVAFVIGFAIADSLQALVLAAAFWG